MSDGFYPAGAGLINYLFKSAHSPFGPNRWTMESDAVDYMKSVKSYLPGVECTVVDEYTDEAPNHRWRVFCR